MNDTVHTALTRALYKVLRPMVRLLMRQGVSYRAFADIARHVFVDVAEEDFALDGRKASHARTAVLTGINRKDIAKLKERPHPLSQSPNDSPTPAAKIITAWLNDSRFHDAAGEPQILAIEPTQAGISFADLVKDYVADIPVRALLDELERIQAVVCMDDKVKLLVKAYLPIANMEESLRIFGTAAADLLRTMDHNIARHPPGLFLQRTVSYDNIPIELLNQIRERSKLEGAEFIVRVNEWLAKTDRIENPRLVGSGKIRAGIGIYYLEHPAEDDQ
jgi:hypothetical protein